MLRFRKIRPSFAGDFLQHLKMLVEFPRSKLVESQLHPALQAATPSGIPKRPEIIAKQSWLLFDMIYLVGGLEQ